MMLLIEKNTQKYFVLVPHSISVHNILQLFSKVFINRGWLTTGIIKARGIRQSIFLHVGTLLTLATLPVSKECLVSPKM